MRVLSVLVFRRVRRPQASRACAKRLYRTGGVASGFGFPVPTMGARCGLGCSWLILEAHRPRRKALGAVIRDRRRAFDMTQEQLVILASDDLVFLRQLDISRIEGGRIELPRRVRLERIAVALDIPRGELFVQAGWDDADKILNGNVPSGTFQGQTNPGLIDGCAGGWVERWRILQRPRSIEPNPPPGVSGLLRSAT